MSGYVAYLIWPGKSHKRQKWTPYGLRYESCDYLWTFSGYFNMSSLYESTIWHKPNAFYGIKKALFIVEIFTFQVAEIQSFVWKSAERFDRFWKINIFLDYFSKNYHRNLKRQTKVWEHIFWCFGLFGALFLKQCQFLAQFLGNLKTNVYF